MNFEYLDPKRDVDIWAGIDEVMAMANGKW